jgi:hypothetical protein
LVLIVLLPKTLRSKTLRFPLVLPNLVKKRYKFQALVTMAGRSDGGPDLPLNRAPRRMVLRGQNDETGHSQIFSALVSCEDEAPFRPNGHQIVATLRLAGDDITDYFHIGGHFDLWLGCEVGHGIVTRRLFT